MAYENDKYIIARSKERAEETLKILSGSRAATFCPVECCFDLKRLHTADSPAGDYLKLSDGQKSMLIFHRLRYVHQKNSVH